MEEQNSPIIFSEWLKRRRKALDMTQGELAERAGCSVGALRKIESGDRRPSKQLAELLAKALEIPDEDQSTFIRVARGELNLKRLSQTPPKPARSLPDIASLRQSPLARAPDTGAQSPRLIQRIPLQAMPLIGREAEFAALERLFNDPQCRLLTLTGIGGIGKTRLAIEFAMSKQVEFPGGVFYIPLAPVDSPAKIVPAIADVLGCVFSGPIDPKEQLLNYIANHIRQDALFVFDNLEHLLVESQTQENKMGVVELTAEILERLPNVKILGTSRERLNIHGEWMYELHGLSVPSTDFVGRFEEYDSIDLFIKSAQRVVSDFQVTADKQPYLIRISQMVEGVPLAIELAAAWAGLLSCQEIAQEIEANLDFLTTSMRDLPERHRSIRATFDHSWKLLSDEERTALCQLSVFHGGFDRIAAQQIAGASLPLLASLSAKSLVRRTDNGRYDLHEVIRQYASSHLNENPHCHETYARYGEYYLAMLQDSEKSLKSASQQETLRHLMNDIDNIRAAWVWATQHQKFDLLGRAGRAFGWYYEIAGMYREGIEQFNLLIQPLETQPNEPETDWVLGLAYIHQALLLFRKGEFYLAQKRYEESIAILRPLDHPALLADALIFLSIILHLSGDFVQAEELAQQGLEIARENNESWYEAYAIYNLGFIDSIQGHFSEGYEQMLAGIAKWRTVGDPHYIALGLNFIIPTMNQLGLYNEARAFTYESIALCEQVKNIWGLGTAYRFLGLTAMAEGQFTEAQTHLRKSLEIFGQDIVGWDIARSLTYLAEAHMKSGEMIEAGQEYLRALLVAIGANSLPIALDALLGLSDLQAQTGKPDDALVLCYTVLNHPASEAETLIRAGQTRAAIESRLNASQIDAAQAAAQEKSFDGIVSDILDQP